MPPSLFSGRVTSSRGSARLLPLALAVAVAVSLASCGSDPPKSSPEAEVRAVLTEFGRASAGKDYEALCGRVLAPALVDRLSAIGLPCPVALRQGLGEVRNPQLRVGKVEVDGNAATAQVRTSAAGQAPSRDTIGLVKVAEGWRVSSLSGGPAPSPTPAAGEN